MCLFCEIANGNIPSYKVYEDDKCLAFLDLSQATIGHTLVVPKKHFNDIFDLDEETSKHLFYVVSLISKKYKEVLDLKAVNIINNSGEEAGQTIKHFHIHIIPRSNDDGVNFKFPTNKLSEEEMVALSKKLHL